jgi:hypothetical protein
VEAKRATIATGKVVVVTPTLVSNEDEGKAADISETVAMVSQVVVLVVEGKPFDVDADVTVPIDQEDKVSVKSVDQKMKATKDGLVPLEDSVAEPEDEVDAEGESELEADTEDVKEIDTPPNENDRTDEVPVEEKLISNVVQDNHNTHIFGVDKCVDILRRKPKVDVGLGVVLEGLELTMELAGGLRCRLVHQLPHLAFLDELVELGSCSARSLDPPLDEQQFQVGTDAERFLK